MARDLNKVMLIGRLGTEPEMRYTANGTPVTSFRMACSRRRTSQDGEPREETDWFTVVGWTKLAEIMGNHLSKGSKIYVEGRLQTRSWDDKETGQKRWATEVVANDMIMLDSRRSQESRQESGEGGGLEDIQVDDIPF
jgi:single-strand DNA-binding protein